MRNMVALLAALVVYFGMGTEAQALNSHPSCQSPYSYSYYCVQVYAQYDQVTCRYYTDNDTYMERTFLRVSYETYSCVDMIYGYYYECNINRADPICEQPVITE